MIVPPVFSSSLCSNNVCILSMLKHFQAAGNKCKNTSRTEHFTESQCKNILHVVQAGSGIMSAMFTCTECSDSSQSRTLNIPVH